MFQSILNHILTVMNSFMDNKYQALVDSFRPFALTILTIYIMITAIIMFTGKSEKAKELGWTALLMSGIASVVFSYSIYKHWILDTIVNTSFYLQGFFLANTATSPAIFFTKIDDTFDLLFATLELIENNVGLLDSISIKIVIFGLAVVFGAIYLVFSVLVIFSIFALYVFFAIGGILLFFAALPQTRFIFWSWLRAVANYALIPVFTSIVMSISLAFLDAVVIDLANLDISEHGVWNQPVANAFFIGILSVFFHLKASEFTAALTGGQPSGVGGFFTTIIGLGAGSVVAGKLGGAKAMQGIKNAPDAVAGVKNLYSKLRGL